MYIYIFSDDVQLYKPTVCIGAHQPESCRRAPQLSRRTSAAHLQTLTERYLGFKV